MAHVYKVSEWCYNQGTQHEQWECGDVIDLAHNSNAWWIPVRILGVSVEDYIKLLVEKYNVSYIKYLENGNVLYFYWRNYNDCHRYVLDINRIARQKGAVVCVE